MSSFRLKNVSGRQPLTEPFPIPPPHPATAGKTQEKVKGRVHITGDALHADGVSHNRQTCGLGEEVGGCLFSARLTPTPAAAQDLSVPSSSFRAALRSLSSESRLDRPPSRIPASLWAPGWPVPSPPAAPHACFADMNTIRCPALGVMVWSQPLMQQRWFKSRLHHVPSATALSPWFVLSFTI